MRKLRIIVLSLAVVLISASLFLFWAGDKYVVPIIMYHSVHEGEPKKANVVSPKIFKEQMEYIKRGGYQVISLKTLVELTKTGKISGKKHVVITFDDGFEDNYTHAFPVLKKYGFPATIFTSVVTLGQEGWLKWHQIFEMEQHGISMESHTLTQAYLPSLSEAEARKEIVESKKILEDNLGHRIYFISYPTGGFSEKIKHIVKDAGYLGACTTNRGYDRLNKDVFELKRIKLGNNDTSGIVLWAKLSGYYNLFREAKSPN